ncbi:methyltransferase [Brenneria roseae subsp. americana]|uniref:Methyltransferase n=1 Tax=Brenneria roseae subsp. americana TaxID=1508507 RepID=A0A2U1U066_9GAMM|nr:MGMT family protein [Brenneria roseae]PWC15049.1 methyltransferase [Brenneria roseae subsp. americana]PWC21302.1 methyltransferase [Brenneria roseae subsp. roseae]
MTGENDNFRQRIFQIVAAIPYGKVTTYGEVAMLAGSPRASRQVGGVLKRLPNDSKLPWHRVINRKGEISLIGADYQRQKSALLSEGIVFDRYGKIDLRRFKWQYAP